MILLCWGRPEIPLFHIFLPFRNLSKWALKSSIHLSIADPKLLHPLIQLATGTYPLPIGVAISNRSPITTNGGQTLPVREYWSWKIAAKSVQRKRIQYAFSSWADQKRRSQSTLNLFPPSKDSSWLQFWRCTGRMSRAGFPPLSVSCPGRRLSAATFQLASAFHLHL